MELVISAITAAATSIGTDHFKRDSGSHIPNISEDGGTAIGFLLEQEWVEVTDEARDMGVAFGNCQYFRAPVPAGITAYEGIALAGDLDEEELKTVRVRKGAHGALEMVADGIEPKLTDVLHIVVGDHEEKRVVYTWYPGRLTPPADLEGRPVKLT